MSNFTNSIAAASHMKLNFVNFVIIFQKLFDVIWSCKNLFISKFPLKMATVGKNSLLTSSNPYFCVQQHIYVYIYVVIYKLFVNYFLSKYFWLSKNYCSDDPAALFRRMEISHITAQETGYLVTFTEKILNENFIFVQHVLF